MAEGLGREKLDGEDPLSFLIDKDVGSNSSTISVSDDIDFNEQSGGGEEEELAHSGDSLAIFQPTRSSNTNTLEKWQKIINREPQLLTGETKTLHNINCSLNTLAGGLILGSLSMTNFRLIFIPSNENIKVANMSEKTVELCCLHLGLSYYQVPLGSIHKIEKFERRDQTSTEKGRVTALFLTIHCKDCRQLKLQLPVCEDSNRAIGVIQSFAYATDISYLFAFQHKIHPSLDIGWDLYDIEKEFKRQGVLKQWTITKNDGSKTKVPCPWKLSMANYDYKVCGSYPELIVVPSELDDATVSAVGAFRSEGRMPALCWGYANSPGSIWRSSQPKVGVQGNTSKADELLLFLVASSISYKERLASASASTSDESTNLNDVSDSNDSAIPSGATTSDFTPSLSTESSNSSVGSGASSSASSSASSTLSKQTPASPRPISATRSISTALHSTFMSSKSPLSSTKSTTSTDGGRVSSTSTMTHGSISSSHQEKYHESSSIPPVVHIIDCRPYTSAKANLLNGYGVESVTNYLGSKISFMDMENIHSIRESYQKLEKVCLHYNNHIHLNNNKDVSWGTTVESTRWLQHMRLFLSCALHVATVVHDLQHPVLVHCSHGWDRTPQITAVAQLLLDPFYRTLAGFPVLVEKEFISFGHPFQKRLAHGLNPTEQSEHQNSQICPIFLQFLDAVWQLQHMFVNLFEFNSRYLLCIAEHLHSCRFGTFIMSTTKQRGIKNETIRKKSTSIWSYLQANHKAFINISYAPPPKNKSTSSSTSSSTAPQSMSSSSSSPAVSVSPAAFLPPKAYVLRNVALWSDYFLRFSPHQSFSHDSFISKQVEFDNDDEDDDNDSDDDLDDDSDDLDDDLADFRGESQDSAIAARRRYSSVKTSQIGDIYMHEASLLSADQDENLHKFYDESEKWKRKALYEQKIEGIGMLFGNGGDGGIDSIAVSSQGIIQAKDKSEQIQALVEKNMEFEKLLREKDLEVMRLSKLNEAQESKIKDLLSKEPSMVSSSSSFSSTSVEKVVVEGRSSTAKDMDPSGDNSDESDNRAESPPPRSVIKSQTSSSMREDGTNQDSPVIVVSASPEDELSDDV